MGVVYHYRVQITDCKSLYQRVQKMFIGLLLTRRSRLQCSLVYLSANGSFNKPLVVYPGAHTPKYNFGGGVNPDDYSLGYSQNGWMTADVFFTWLSSIFYPEIKDSVSFPVIFFLDGHTSHINLAIADFCAENNIILYCFPAHASHILQPLDVSVFGPLKKKWNKSINHFRNQYGVAITRSQFFQVFDTAWKASINQPNNVVFGFRACGLVPFNVDNVNFSKLLDANAAKDHNESRKNLPLQHLNSYEKLGAVRTFQITEKRLPAEMKNDFERQYSEGYDLEDSTHKGILWTIYKDVQKLTTNYTLAEESISLEVNNDTFEGENETTVSSDAVETPETPHADSFLSQEINSAAKCKKQSNLSHDTSLPTRRESIIMQLGESRVSVVPDATR